MGMNTRNWFATVPKAMESLLAAEIRSLGGHDTRETLAGVHFSGSLETVYKVVLWSRLASRVMMPLATFAAPDRETLYRNVKKINWERHLSCEMTLAVRSNCKGSQLTHAEFVNRVVKDAIVDRFRDREGQRPSVDRVSPSIVIHCRLKNDEAVVSIELTSGVLHRRGYRTEQGMAPLRENVAAAMLMRAGWPQDYISDAAFIDPMCGSGTLVIEAVLLAADIAPGLMPGFTGINDWFGHDLSVWNSVLEEAEKRRKEGLKNLGSFNGYDPDPQVLDYARKNAARAQIEFAVDFEQCSMEEVRPPENAPTGLIAVNPPYGNRLSGYEDVSIIYQNLGKLWASRFSGWKAVLITDDDAHSRAVGLRAFRTNKVFNGGIPCLIAQFKIQADNEFRESSPGIGVRFGLEPQRRQYAEETGAFANRLKKNQRKLKPWLKKQKITSYRLYDADLPNFAVAVDCYEGKWVVIQEYAPPARIDPIKANDRLHDAIGAIVSVLDIPVENVFLKQRRKRGSSGQYEKLDHARTFEVIKESGLTFLVNFSDYLDVGIFLDHRPVRQLIKKLATGRRFLNLYSYTGTATVYAISGGSVWTRSVDTSNTYLGWTEANLRRNQINPEKHSLIRGDCMEWLAVDTDTYDLIFCDPPTHSVSKDRRTFNIQKDHPRLIDLAMKRLTEKGEMIFSTNFRQFKLDPDIEEKYAVKEITRDTIPRDFSRNAKIHRCWIITFSASR